MKAVAKIISKLSNEQTRILLALMTTNKGIGIQELAERSCVPEGKILVAMRQLVDAGIVRSGLGVYEFNVSCDNIPKAEAAFASVQVKKPVAGGSVLQNLLAAAPTAETATQTVDSILELAKMSMVVDSEMDGWQDVLRNARTIALAMFEKHVTFESVARRYRSEYPNLALEGGANALKYISIALSTMPESRAAEYGDVRVVQAETLFVPNAWEV